ncbi:unnamed protein product, partial [Symbiodinium microadriaticum]
VPAASSFRTKHDEREEQDEWVYHEDEVYVDDKEDDTVMVAQTTDASLTDVELDVFTSFFCPESCNENDHESLAFLLVQSETVAKQGQGQGQASQLQRRKLQEIKLRSTCATHVIDKSTQACGRGGTPSRSKSESESQSYEPEETANYVSLGRSPVEWDAVKYQEGSDQGCARTAFTLLCAAIQNVTKIHVDKKRHPGNPLSDSDRIQSASCNGTVADIRDANRAVEFAIRAYTLQAGVEDGDVLSAAITDILGCRDMKRWEATSAKFVKQIWMTDCIEQALSNPKCNKHSDKRLGPEHRDRVSSPRTLRKAGQKAGDPFYDDYKPADDQLTEIVGWIDTVVMIADPMTKVMELTKLGEVLRGPLDQAYGLAENCAGGPPPPGVAELGADVWRRDIPLEGRGLVVPGTAIGHPHFVAAWAAQRMRTEREPLHQLPLLPDLQCAWLLLAMCASPRANHALPQAVAFYAHAHDAAIWETLELCLGLGLRSAVRTATAAYWAACADALLELHKRSPVFAEARELLQAEGWHECPFREAI